jgi:hypothetical protein
VARVLVVFESGTRGDDAVLEAAALARDGGGDAELIVVALAPSQPVVRCGPSDDALDLAVIEAAEGELAHARRLLAGDDAALRVVYETLAHADARSLAALISARGAEVVVFPRRRLLVGGHVRVRAVERLIRAEIVVAGGGSARPYGSGRPV